MERELFGPIATAHIYPAHRYAETLDLVDRHVAVRADRRSLRARARGDRAGARAPALRRRQLLRQRQADRRRGRPAAVRRGPRVGHERQGRLDAEPGALGIRPHREGDVRAARRTSPTRRCARRSPRAPRASLAASGAALSSRSGWRSGCWRWPFRPRSAHRTRRSAGTSRPSSSRPASTPVPRQGPAAS